MNKNLTDLTLIVDRSGSMGFGDFHLDMQGGIKTLINEQKEVDGDCNLTLIEFDNQYDVLQEGVDIKKFENYKLVPRGGTALCDAVGKGINSVGKRLCDMKEEDRPATVIFVIITDGGENASSEYTKEQIQDMVKKQENEFNWKFVFLGAEIDAFSEAGGIGVKHGSTTSFSKKNTQAAYSMTSNKMSSIRGMAAEGQDMNFEYSASERSALNE